MPRESNYFNTALHCFQRRVYKEKKEKHLAGGDPEEWGDAYTQVGLDNETRLIISHLVGKRDGACANEFVRDLSDRILGRCQAASDGFKPYIEAVAEAWGADMDIAQLTKARNSHTY